jgi:hypothetical protein
VVSSTVLNLAVGAAVPWGSGTKPVLASRAELEGTWGKWLYGMRAGIETATPVAVSVGAVTIANVPVDVFAGYVLIDRRAAGLALVAGAGIDVVDIGVSFRQHSSLLLLQPVFSIGIEAERRLGARLGLVAAGDLAFSPPRGDLTIANVGTVGHIPVARARLLLGVSWHFL